MGSAQERETTDFIQKKIKEVNQMSKNGRSFQESTLLALGTDCCNSTANHLGASKSEGSTKSVKLKNTLE